MNSFTLRNQYSDAITATVQQDGCVVLNCANSPDGQDHLGFEDAQRLHEAIQRLLRDQPH